MGNKPNFAFGRSILFRFLIYQVYDALQASDLWSLSLWKNILKFNYITYKSYCLQLLTGYETVSISVYTLWRSA